MLIQADEIQDIKIKPHGKKLNKKKGKNYTEYEFLLYLGGKPKVVLTFGFDKNSDVATLDFFGKAVNKLGPTVIRKALRFLKKKFPQIKKVTGERVSGSREKFQKLDRIAELNLLRAQILARLRVYAELQR